MSREGFKGPKLPKELLDQVGGAGDKRKRDVPRKDRRKAERQQKKATRSRPPPRKETSYASTRRQAVVESDDEEKDVAVRSPPPARVPKPAEKLDEVAIKSILKKKPTATPPQRPPQALPSPTPSLEDGIDEDLLAQDSDGSDDSFTVSRQAAKAGLSKEDDAITALERKLGKRGGKKTKTSTAVDSDGDEGDGDGELDWLLGGVDSGSEDENRGVKRKRAAPADEKWLRDKRRKAGGTIEQSTGENEDDALGSLSDDEDLEGMENPFSDDEVSDNSFGGFSGDDDGEETPQSIKRVRENPYIAPLQSDSQSAPSAAVQSTTKYIPPSLRAKFGSSDSDATLQQLQRQIQGQLNRLSEANMLSILRSIEQIYTTNPRQHVTSSLVDLLITRVSDPARLEDAYVVLHAGFSAALYRVIGVAFGAQLLDKIVETFDGAYGAPQNADGAAATALPEDSASSVAKKQKALNTIAFAAVLYNLNVVGAAIIFDYIRQLLSGVLSETNAEILLRVVHFSGQQLRAEDPSSLKDIVLLLQRKVSEAGGEDKVPPRIKFLIREINDLKNNRQKATGGAPGGSSKTIVSEHLTTTRKTLGSLSTSRGGKAPEPLRPTLADIRNSAEKGKWWLPGASWHDPAKVDATTGVTTSTAAADDAGYESETPGHVNLSALARAQGMNTSVRRSIFITIMSSADYRDAHLRLVKLHLKAKQLTEISRVLIHCVGAEGTYNPYYALIAKKFCEDARVKKAFKFGLWDVLKRLEEEEEEGEGMSVKMIGNLAKFFASLMAADLVSGLELDVLKKIDFGPYMPAQMAVFTEALLTSLLLQVKKEKGESHERIITLFRTVDPDVGKPLQDFLTRIVSEGDMAAGSKEKRALEKACRSAVQGLKEAEKEGVGRRAGDTMKVASDDEDQEDGNW